MGHVASRGETEADVHQLPARKTAAKKPAARKPRPA
jgi:hypothetical protein